MSKEAIPLYTINKNVKCLKCGNKGAVKSYGKWCPDGLGDSVGESKFLEKYRNNHFMNHTCGFGGTIPHECLNCGNFGLIDIDGLEGYEKAFDTIKGGEKC